MKTVIDAVNEFKGEWPCGWEFMCQASKLNVIYPLGTARESINPDVNDRHIHLCSKKEFLATVAECETNFGKVTHGEHYVHGNKKLLDKECRIMNTVKHKGKIYQIGCFYEFKDKSSAYWEVGVLCAYNEGKFKSKRGNKQEWFDLIMRCTGVMGTVEDAPITLIDGKAYQFEYDGQTINGCYNKFKTLLYSAHKEYLPHLCTNIQPLTVEVK